MYLSIRCLYEDAEFNVLAFGSDGKTASAFDCLGVYDTLSEIGKRKREFICWGAEVKLRLIVLRMCKCGVISHFYRKKLDVAERGEGGPGSESSGWRASPPPPIPRGSGVESLSGGFSVPHRGTAKCNFTATPQTGKECFFCLFQIRQNVQ